MNVLKTRASVVSAIACVLMALTACGNPKNTDGTAGGTTNDNAKTPAHSESHSASHVSVNHDAKSSVDTKPHTQAYMATMHEMGDKMSRASALQDPDVAFASGMISHHVGAVEMAKVQLEYGKDETLRKLAQTIIDGQQVEIDLMTHWLQGKDTTSQDPNSAHAKAYAADHSHEAMMTAIYEPDPDVAFAKAMIPHHEGAVSMAKIQLQYGKDETMRKLAQAIIDAQEPEIRLMQDWLKPQGQ